MGLYVYRRLIAAIMVGSLLIAVSAQTCGVAMAQSHLGAEAMSEMTKAPNACKACEKNDTQNADCLLLSCFVFTAGAQDFSFESTLQVAFFTNPAHRLFAFSTQPFSPPI